MIGIRVGYLIRKIKDGWYKQPIRGLFDVDILLANDKNILSIIERMEKVKCIGYSKYGIYFLDVLSLGK